MIERRDRLDLLAMGLMTLFGATWGLNQVAAKVADAGISPLLQGGLRSIGATILLVGWARLRGEPLFARDGTLWPGLLIGLMFALEFGLMFWGLEYTPASRGVVFLYTAPFVVAGGLHWLVPAERLRLWQVVGLVCAFAGILAAFREGLAMPEGKQIVGDLMQLGAAIVWAGTTILIRASRLASVSATKTLFYQLAVSSVAMPLGAWAVGEPGFTHPSAWVWSSLAFQIVIVAFASYLGWFWLILHYPATRLAAFSFLTPLFGVIFGAVLLGEPVTPLLALALALVSAGLWLVNRKPAA